MPSEPRVLTPTQSRTIQDAVHVPLKIQTSRSLRWNLLDSPDLSRVGEDTTLFYVPRSSEYDLTACASTSSGFKTLKNSVLPSSLELLLPDLPEIPDLYEDPAQEPESITAVPVFYTPTLDTPQSDYHSLSDYHPTSLCCQDVLTELAGAQCSDGANPELWSLKHNPEPPHTVQAPCHRRPRISRHIRRSYSLDLLGDGRTAELPYVVRSCFLIPTHILTFYKIPLNVGLGYGLGSPFIPSPISFPVDPDLDLHTLPTELVQYASPSLHSNLLLSPSSPGLRRYEALSVWRPHCPPPPVRAGTASDPDSDDVRSLEQPFPSSASLWVLDPPPTSRLAQSASWPLAHGAARHHRKEKEVWTLEEQITIAVLQAMDSRDMRAAGQQGQAVRSRLAVRSSKKSKFRRLLGKFWRREGVW
ncbi:hypothetical protein B0H19DRAFT_1099944 [Mycena capillaripes]|nr:hypothetical protein B0H19DRAFT_1099944 [Mycena capillaripes]